MVSVEVPFVLAATLFRWRPVLINLVLSDFSWLKSSADTNDPNGAGAVAVVADMLRRALGALLI